MSGKLTRQFQLRSRRWRAEKYHGRLLGRTATSTIDSLQPSPKRVTRYVNLFPAQVSRFKYTHRVTDTALNKALYVDSITAPQASSQSSTQRHPWGPNYNARTRRIMLISPTTCPSIVFLTWSPRGPTKEPCADSDKHPNECCDDTYDDWAQKCSYPRRSILPNVTLRPSLRCCKWNSQHPISRPYIICWPHDLNDQPREPGWIYVPRNCHHSAHSSLLGHATYYRLSLYSYKFQRSDYENTSRHEVLKIKCGKFGSVVIFTEKTNAAKSRHYLHYSQSTAPQRRSLALKATSLIIRENATYQTIWCNYFTQFCESHTPRCFWTLGNFSKMKELLIETHSSQSKSKWS